MVTSDARPPGLVTPGAGRITPPAASAPSAVAPSTLSVAMETEPALRAGAPPVRQSRAPVTIGNAAIISRATSPNPYRMEGDRLPVTASARARPAATTAPCHTKWIRAQPTIEMAVMSALLYFLDRGSA